MPVYKDPKTERWYATVYYQGKMHKTRTLDGQRLKTKSDAKQAEHKLLESLMNNEKKTRIDVLSAFDEYLADTKDGLKESTLSHYQEYKHNYLEKYLNKNDIHKLTIKDIRSFKEAIINKHFRNSHTNRLLHTLKSFLEYLSIIHKIDSSIQQPLLQNVRIKEFEENEETYSEQGKWINPDEFNKIVEQLDTKDSFGFIFYVIFHVLMYSGIRIGELVALRKEDFKIQQDSQIGILHICKTYSRVNGKDLITTPKTKKSRRNVLLDEHTTLLISNYIERNNKHDEDILFSENENYLCMQKIRRVFNRLRDSADIPNEKKSITIHSLRHSHISYLNSLGFDALSISHRVGHSSPDITMRVYTHTNEKEEQIEIADAITKKTLIV